MNTAEADAWYRVVAILREHQFNLALIQALLDWRDASIKEALKAKDEKKSRRQQK